MWEEESLHALLNDDEPDAAVAQDELGTALPPEGKPEDFSIVPREDHPEDLRIAPREDNPEDKPRYEYVVTMRAARTPSMVLILWPSSRCSRSQHDRSRERGRRLGKKGARGGACGGRQLGGRRCGGG